jgi:hypothetical protein
LCAQTWRPLGLATLVNPDGSMRADDSAEQKQAAAALASSTHPRRYSLASSVSQANSTGVASEGPMGCPIRVQTAPGIKMFTQVT